MTAPLIAQIERERNLAELEGTRTHMQDAVQYHEQEAARFRKLLEGVERAIATVRAQMAEAAHE